MKSSPPYEEGDGGGPLEKIASLEQELADRHAKTRAKAEKLIEQTKKEAEQRIEASRSSLPQYLEKLRQEVLEDYQRQVQELTKAWGKESSSLSRRAEKNLSLATDFLLETILSAGEESES